MTPARSIVACALTALASAGCEEAVVVHIPWPSDRYDHNRTRLVSLELPAPPSASSGAAVAAPFVRTHGPYKNADYAPENSAEFSVRFAIRPGEMAAGVDRLPAANLVPAFTGLPLPISRASCTESAKCASDRDDLIDYLSAGPGAQVGVERGSAIGDVGGTESTYAPILDVLVDPDLASRSKSMIQWELGLVTDRFADTVSDSRYPPGAISDSIAVRFCDFWFVLDRFPNRTGFTRLVVVPVDFKQNIAGKQPGASCQRDAQRGDP